MFQLKSVSFPSFLTQTLTDLFSRELSPIEKITAIEGKAEDVH